MLRKAAFLVAVIVIVWWVRDGDPQSLKRELLELRDGKTQFAPDGAGGRSDWGAG